MIYDSMSKTQKPCHGKKNLSNMPISIVKYKHSQPQIWIRIDALCERTFLQIKNRCSDVSAAMQAELGFKCAIKEIGSDAVCGQ